MNKDFVISGVHIGEHGFEPDAIIDEIQSRCVKNNMNFVTLRIGSPEGRKQIKEQDFYDWAKFLYENKIYFLFLYSLQYPPKGAESVLNREIISNIKRIAGEYFLGDMLGEIGSSYACKWRGYYGEHLEKLPVQGVRNMEEAKNNYLEVVSNYVALDKSLGIDDVSTVEATALNCYNMEAGVTLPMLELMCGNPEILIPFLRGTARAYNAKLWGTYIAHEWYGGMHHEDVLKQKRLSLAYKYAYLSGSNVFCLESGDEAISSFGYRYDKDSHICKNYQNVSKDFAKFIKSDCRPVGGPKVKIAFVQGNLDAWGGWGGSSVWSQFDSEEWGYSYPEHSWRILDEIGTKRNWSDVANYGEYDFSALPAYGQYDVIPACSSVETMQKYDYIIFVGFNAMTDEIYKNLCGYVKGGGILFITAAHLNTNTVRNNRIHFIKDGNVEELFGCKLLKPFSVNKGIKFTKTSLVKSLKYPFTKNLSCDPILSAGFARYAESIATSGQVTAILSDELLDTVKNPSAAIVENKFGDGVAILLTSCDYPGHSGIYPIYRTIVREVISSSQRNCDIKVLATDRVRYAVYDNKLYLINTDYDLPAVANIMLKNDKKVMTLQPLELNSICID